MKHVTPRSALAVAAAALALNSLSFAQAPVAYDGFNYGSGANLNGLDGGYGWSAPWADAASSIATVPIARGLTYPGLLTTPGAASTPQGAGDSLYQRTITPYVVPESKMYLSFLYRPNDGYGNYGGVSFGPYHQRTFVGTPTGTFTYGLELGNGLQILSNVPATTGVTTLLVLEMTTLPNAHQYRLYINPVVGAAQPRIPSAESTVTFGTAVPAWLSLRNDGGATTDELRLGVTWRSVLPRLGDVDLDGAINVNDLLAVITTWGPCPARCPADVNQDGVVDVNDLLLVITNWD